MESLVRKLPDGPFDVVGDVHGDIDALHELLNHLGYDDDGSHVDGRFLVFVGDLTDRGPDSVAVIHLVQRLVETGMASCVLGNHELNIMLGQEKFDNGWFFGEKCFDKTGKEIKQNIVSDSSDRDAIVEFFRSLPLALQREDARIVHACWQPEMVEVASEATDVLKLYEQHRFNINLGLAIRSDMQDWQKEQRHQNLNPVKVLTSGLEVRVDEPFEASGKVRYLDRAPWWNDYKDEAFCFIGHYSQPYGELRGVTRAICVDYGVAKRWVPKTLGDDSPRKWRLAAIRFPELQVVFDNGEEETIRVLL